VAAVDGSGFRVGAGGRMMDRVLINIDLLPGKFAGEPRSSAMDRDDESTLREGSKDERTGEPEP
jgi:hypothetical protein